MTNSLPAAFFDALYADKADPWGFATSPYEKAKYARTIEALRRPRYSAGFEVGCSIGVLTQALAERCDRLLSVDASDRALAEAARICAAHANVGFARMHVPGDWPEGRFDLMVFSEVLYFLSPDDLRRMARLAAASLAEGADVLLVHWLGETNYPCTADEASEIFIAGLGLPHRLAVRETDYRLDLLGA